MPLKNYTSQQAASRSLDAIERLLVSHGARMVVKNYDDQGRVASIFFQLTVPIKDRLVPLHFKLPARVASCEQVLFGELGPRARPETKKKIPAQAERTAWKIILDWIEAQMAMVDLAQVEVQEVMLPYLYDPVKETTFYEQVKKGGKLIEHYGS